MGILEHSRRMLKIAFCRLLRWYVAARRLGDNKAYVFFNSPLERSRVEYHKRKQDRQVQYGCLQQLPRTYLTREICALRAAQNRITSTVTGTKKITEPDTHMMTPAAAWSSSPEMFHKRGTAAQVG